MELPNKLILVIDDSSVTLHFLSELLKSKGYKVLTARNGKQAIDLFKNNMPDLVLLDLLMPDMSGFEILDYVKSQSFLQTIPIMY